MSTLRTILLYLLAIPKTVFFNLRYLPLRDAVKLPFIVSHRVWLFRAGGAVRLETAARFGLVKIGFGQVAIFDQHRSRSMWEVEGTVRFKGECTLGHGSKISVGAGAVLTLGAGFTITAESAIVAKHAVSIGDDCLFSWDVLVMDTDFHTITAGPAATGEPAKLNPDAEVVIGDHVWVGCRCLILKGSLIADGCVVAAGSTVTGMFDNDNALLGGVPARVLRDGVSWE